METHTRSQFARHLENISQVTIKGRWKCCGIERLVSYKVDPPYQKLICKTLREYSSRNYQGSFKMLSNRLDSTRVERLVSVKVDPSLARHLENILQVTSKSRRKCCRLESNDSSLLMSTFHTGSRFAKHYANFPQEATKGDCRYCRIDLIQLKSNDSPQLIKGG